MRAIMIPVAAAVGAIVLATSASTADSSQNAARRCPRVESHLLAANSRAEVYEAPEGPRSTELAVFGCAYRNGRAFELGGVASRQGKGGPGGESGVLDATLASTVVAYAKTRYYETGGSRKVVIVRNLRTGRILHEVLTGTRVKPEPPTEGVGAVQALVVKSDGSVAWTVAAGPEEGTYQVHAVDKTGSRMLATGGDIAPGSLAVAGSTMYWTQAGIPQSASLN
jgi:hypothetical protein